MVRWFRDSVCLFAIETTFPLSDFKTKYIVGIPMERFTFLKPFGAPKASQFFFLWETRKKNQGAIPPEGEGNPTEGGNFASYY